MEKSILQHIFPTKLSPPNADFIVPRNRIFRKLDDMLATGAVWVQGPPGAGKTALLASWIKERNPSVLWIQLDEGDSDIATFFHYLTRAIQRSMPQAELPAFTSEWLGTPHVFARKYFRRLFKYQDLPQLWVMDDYHTIDSVSGVHKILSTGLAEKPASVQFAILSRMKPPPSLTRQTLHGKMSVMRPEELSLTFGETKTIASSLGYQIKLEQLESLREKADGWVVGLQLLLTLFRNADEHASREQMLFDYFAEEVFDRMDETERSVLVATSVAPEFTEKFTVSLTEVNDAGAILDNVVRKCGFLYRLHGLPAAYRYHPLFREYLLSIAEDVFGKRLSSLKLRAAELLWKEGREETAIEMACQVEDWDLVENYLLEIAPKLQQEGRLEIIRTTIARFPREQLQRNPWLLYWHGIALFQTNSVHALTVLTNSFHEFDGRSDIYGRALAWSAISEFLIFSLDGISGLEYWLERLDDVCSDFNTFPLEIQMNVAAAVIDLLVHFKPEHSGLKNWTQTAITLMQSGAARTAQRFHLARALMFYAGFWGNDLPFARHLINMMGRYVKEVNPFNRLLWIMAEGYCFLNAAELKKCVAAIEEGLAVANDSGYAHWNGILAGIGAQAASRMGDEKRRHAYLSLMCTHRDELRHNNPNRQRINEYFFHYVLTFLAQCDGDHSRAHKHCRIAIDLANECGMPFLQSSTCVLTALYMGDFPRRKKLIEALHWGQRNRHVVAEACANLALAYHYVNTGNNKEALEHLGNGMEQSRRSGVINFILVPSMFSKICAFAKARNIEAEHASRMLEKLNIPTSTTISSNVTQHLLILEEDGHFKITRGDKALPTTTKRPRKLFELLKRLVDAGPGGCPLETLADDLWTDTDGDRAIQSLHTTVHRLRKYLGDSSFVICENGRFFLNEKNVFVDMWVK